MATILREEDAYTPAIREPEIFKGVDFEELYKGPPQSFHYEYEVDNLAALSDQLEENNEDDGYYGGTVELALINKCFSELSKEMVPLDSGGLIKKMVLKKGKQGKNIEYESEILINYDLYLNGAERPFDYQRRDMEKPIFDPLHYFVYGKQVAILSMEVGEKAIFIISWKLAFGELGCVTRVPPETDILAVIEILDVVSPDSKPMTLHGSTSEFISDLQKIKIIRKQAKKNFEKKSFEASLVKYNEAMFILDHTTTSSDEEDVELKNLKVAFHVNLAIVHNKLKNSNKALINCNKALELDDNNEKAIFHRGRAFLQMNDFTKAANELKKGQMLFPDNMSFGKELFELTKKQEISISAQLGKAIFK